MNSKTKDLFQYITAVVVIALGACLCWYAKLKYGHIEGNDLGYLGECLTFGGGIFGVTLYIRYKTADAYQRLKEDIATEIKQIGKETRANGNNQEKDNDNQD